MVVITSTRFVCSIITADCTKGSCCVSTAPTVSKPSSSMRADRSRMLRVPAKPPQLSFMAVFRSIKRDQQACLVRFTRSRKRSTRTVEQVIRANSAGSSGDPAYSFGKAGKSGGKNGGDVGERAHRIAVARHVLELMDRNEPAMGEESWEVDVGRFIDQDRFDLEKQK